MGRRTGWPAFDAALTALRTGPPRTGSLIVTVFGDAVLPRGGALALADLLLVLRRLGATDGMVRTAVSRLAQDGLLTGRRVGRHSAYALTTQGKAEFTKAMPRIYGPAAPIWDGRLRLAFPQPGTPRAGLDAAGFATLTPGVLIGIRNPPPGVPFLRSDGDDATLRELSARAWPLATLAGWYDDFVAIFQQLERETPPTPLDAMAARTAVIHAWRRIALRDPHLPEALLPTPWPGHLARELCMSCYAALAPGSEAWLDGAGSGAGLLPPGPDPAIRFSAADTRRGGRALSRAPTGTQRQLRSATR